MKATFPKIQVNLVKNTLAVFSLVYLMLWKNIIGCEVSKEMNKLREYCWHYWAIVKAPSTCLAVLQASVLIQLQMNACTACWVEIGWKFLQRRSLHRSSCYRSQQKYQQLSKHRSSIESGVKLLEFHVSNLDRSSCYRISAKINEVREKKSLWNSLLNKYFFWNFIISTRVENRTEIQKIPKK